MAEHGLPPSRSQSAHLEPARNGHHLESLGEHFYHSGQIREKCPNRSASVHASLSEKRSSLSLCLSRASAGAWNAQRRFHKKCLAATPGLRTSLSAVTVLQVALPVDQQISTPPPPSMPSCSSVWYLQPSGSRFGENLEATAPQTSQLEN